MSECDYPMVKERFCEVCNDVTETEFQTIMSMNGKMQTIEVCKICDTEYDYEERVKEEFNEITNEEAQRQSFAPEKAKLIDEFSKQLKEHSLEWSDLLLKLTLNTLRTIVGNSDKWAKKSSVMNYKADISD